MGNNPQGQLNSAAAEGNLQQVEELIAARCDPNEHAGFFMTPLHWAARNGHVEVVRKIVELRADIEKPCSSIGMRAIHFAAEQNHRGVLILLSELRADMGAKDDPSKRNVVSRLFVAGSSQPRSAADFEMYPNLFGGRADFSTSALLTAQCRAFETSNFKREYDALLPQSGPFRIDLDGLKSAAEGVVRDFATAMPQAGIDAGKQADFIQRLEADCMKFMTVVKQAQGYSHVSMNVVQAGWQQIEAIANGTAVTIVEESEDSYQVTFEGKFAWAKKCNFERVPEPVEVTVERAWTCLAECEGIEFCHMVNHLLCQDELVKNAAIFVRALNTFCVTGAGRGPNLRPAKWPDSGRVYRAGGMPVVHRNFFRRGVTYRAPRVVPASFEYQEFFAKRAARRPPDAVEPIKWTIILPSSKECRQANYVTNRADGLKDEKEFLFAAYSVFKVASVEWSPRPDEQPHEICLEVPVDNRDKQPEYLAIAPWC